MAARDHYRLLGVQPTATRGAIHAAYRLLAWQHHPDRSGDESTMKLLNVAWFILQDDSRRSAYDAERRQGAPESVIAAAPTTASDDHAGPPPGRPFGHVMTYGRYQGWSLGEIAQHDPEFLQWLRRIPSGRPLRREIDSVLEELERTPHTLGGRRPSRSA